MKAHHARIEGLDDSDRTALRATFKAQLGDGYRPTMRQVKGYFTDQTRFPDGFGEALLQARGPDGRLLIHHSDFIPWARSVSLEADPARKAAARREEIIKIRDTNIGRYHKEKLGDELTALEQQGAGKVEISSTPTEDDAREAEITQVMRTDIDRYRRERNGKGQTLADELGEIQRKKSKQQGVRR